VLLVDRLEGRGGGFWEWAKGVKVMGRTLEEPAEAECGDEAHVMLVIRENK
jgi:hypothetical protein